MHILFLTDNFPPEVNAPASRTFEHCREWVRAGEKVTVITGAPNFPTGKVYDGYCNKLWQDEVVDGIRIIRVWTYITANEGFIKRTLDYISFMLTASFAALFVRRVDVVIGTSPQFFTACAAWFVALLKRTPWVFELRDIWPEQIKVVGAISNSLAIRGLERIEMSLYSHASKIVAVTNTFKKTLVSRGVDGNKIEVVTNGVDLSRFSHQNKDIELVEKLGLDGKFVVGYIGTHGLCHGLETLLEAADILQQTPDVENIRLLFLGDGACKAKLVAEAHARGLENVLFIDSVSKSEVVRYWSLLDVSAIHLRKAELFSSVIPSKLFECLGMGIPVLHGVPGESAEIVYNEQVGDVFESENAKQFVDKLLQMRDNPANYIVLQKNCLRAATHFDRCKLAMNMLNIIREVVKN